MTTDIALLNSSGRRLESQMIVPVPDGAVLRGFMFEGGGSAPTAELIARAESCPGDTKRDLTLAADHRPFILLPERGKRWVVKDHRPRNPSKTKSCLDKIMAAQINEPLTNR